ncbi:unnamed protein product [Calypogeia fissa]
MMDPNYTTLHACTTAGKRERGDSECLLGPQAVRQAPARPFGWSVSRAGGPRAPPTSSHGRVGGKPGLQTGPDESSGTIDCLGPGLAPPGPHAGRCGLLGRRGFRAGGKQPFGLQES